MQNPQFVGTEGWVEFPFNGDKAVIKNVRVHPDRIEFSILSQVPLLGWSVECDPKMEAVVLHGKVGAFDAIKQLKALHGQIEENKKLILEACRLYGARTAKLTFPGSTDY